MASPQFEEVRQDHSLSLEKVTIIENHGKIKLTDQVKSSELWGEGEEKWEKT